MKSYFLTFRFQKFQKTIKPSSEWGPAKKIYKDEYLHYLSSRKARKLEENQAKKKMQD